MGKLDTYYEAWKNGDLETGLACYSDSSVMVSAEDGVVTDHESIAIWMKLDWLAFSLRTMDIEETKIEELDQLVMIDIRGKSEDFSFIHMSAIFVFDEDGKVSLRTSKSALQKMGEPNFIAEEALYESEIHDRETAQLHEDYMKAIQKGDLDAILDHYAYDAKIVDENHVVHEGRDSIRSYFENYATFCKSSGRKIIKQNTNVAQDVAIVHMQLKQTNCIHMDGAATYFYKDGKITHHVVRIFSLPGC